MCIAPFRRLSISSVYLPKSYGCVLEKFLNSFSLERTPKADYWKSNARKYCDFCKCWIAENKTSISLHEDGKRHKENVAKRITSINKKSAADRKETKKMEKEMDKMEKVAMAAYLKDIENNADLTSQIINEKLAEANKYRHLVSHSSTTTPAAGSSTAPQSGTKKKVWQEAKTIQGHTYYWNTETNETVWEPPEEGYVSFAEIHKKDQKPPPKPSHKPPKSAKKNKGNFKFKPKRAPAEPAPEFGPVPAGAPFGKWKVVKHEEAVDLQLPEQRQAQVVAPVIAIPVEKQFREKQITTLEEDSEVKCEEINFKKRKINSNAKRNTRQRLDDD